MLRQVLFDVGRPARTPTTVPRLASEWAAAAPHFLRGHSPKRRAHVIADPAPPAYTTE